MAMMEPSQLTRHLKYCLHDLYHVFSERARILHSKHSVGYSDPRIKSQLNDHTSADRPHLCSLLTGKTEHLAIQSQPGFSWDPGASPGPLWLPCSATGENWYKGRPHTAVSTTLSKTTPCPTKFSSAAHRDVGLCTTPHVQNTGVY